MENKLYTKIAKDAFDIIKKGDKILLGLSGGADSVFLFYFFLKLKNSGIIKFHTAHINHCLRGKDSKEDEKFVQELSHKFQIPCHIKREDIKKLAKEQKKNLEETGRNVRYAFFHKILNDKKLDKIATAHNFDDNVELVLMNFLRGSGLKGISGISRVNNKIIRPLIEIKKKEILKYLKESKMPFREDASNENSCFIRNKIRKRLIPYLEKNYNKNISKRVQTISEIVAKEDFFLEGFARKRFEKTILKKDDEKLVLSLPSLKKEDIAIRRRVIREALLSLNSDLKRISFAHTDKILSLIEKQKGFKFLNLPFNIKIVKEQKELIFTKEDIYKDYSSSLVYEINNSNLKEGFFHIKEKNIILKFEFVENFNKNNDSNVAVFDFDKLSFPIYFRSVKKGDVFRPLGIKGTKKISKFFIDNKIKFLDRKKAFVFLSNDEIFWLVGHRISNDFKVTEETKVKISIKVRPLNKR